MKIYFFRLYLTKAEMLALSMEDIDLENCQIHIRKTYYRMNRTDIITEPKTDNSVTHSNSLSNKMGNSLLAVRGINHKYIVVGRKKII
ncbi:hypothetical protein FMM75_10390 [Lachnospiraceae bacterium MD335]|nr:hypothetical protein [Lachnospiraceae bacterium MD335]